MEDHVLAQVATWRRHSTTEAGADKAALAFREMENGVLDIIYCDLVTLPPELGQCQNLEKLICFNNQLVTLPPELGQCQKLKMLNVFNNRLASLPPELGQCQNLEMLNVFNNRLASLPPELGQCSNLKKLFCACNQLETLPPELGQCQNLEELDCENNPLSEFEGPDKGNPIPFLRGQWAERNWVKSAKKA